MSTIASFEQQVFNIEGVRIVVREKRDLETPGLEYTYKRRLGRERSVSDLKSRVNDCLNNNVFGPNDIEFEIISGTRVIEMDNSVTIGAIRDSYVKK